MYVCGHLLSLYLLHHILSPQISTPSPVSMMKPSLLLLAICSFAYVSTTHGHGAVTNPPPRNAIDSDLQPWGGDFPKGKVPFEPWCPFPSALAVDSDPNGRNL